MGKSQETPAQKIKRLERELADEQLNNKILNTMIDISDKQYGTSIRKKFSPKPSNASSKKGKWVCLAAVDCLGSQDNQFIKVDKEV